MKLYYCTVLPGIILWLNPSSKQKLIFLVSISVVKEGRVNSNAKLCSDVHAMPHLENGSHLYTKLSRSLSFVFSTLFYSFFLEKDDILTTNVCDFRS